MPMGQMPNVKCHIDPVFHMTFGIWPIDPLTFGFYSTVLVASVNPFLACFRIQRITRPLL